MSAKVVTPAEARLELIVSSAEAESMSGSDFYAWLKDKNFSDEAAIRLKALADLTADVGGKIINMGKIILMKIQEFVKAHPNLALGVAIGAAIAAFVSLIPLLGPILAPIAAMAGIALGALHGHRLDKIESGKVQVHQADPLFQEVMEIATVFFKLFADIVNSVLDSKSLRGS
jgi:ElaB/YqjD/DUF883 family membrane-anchored ribosome-binding protein